jgi:SAM-dependent methyltransferase
VPLDVFDVPRIAAILDPTDPDRSDLDVYAAMVDEFGATSVLDVGCGTGTLAVMLAARGIRVTGVDPAGTSLDVARAKPGADLVTWVHGVATDLQPLQVDLAFMTANVAQVFLTDEDWISTLKAIASALRPGGRLVFETRDPAREAWLSWTRETTYERFDLPEIGVVESWMEPAGVDGEIATFRATNVFESDGTVIEGDFILRFRDREAIEAQLAEAGFVVDEVRDAPDRPGREFVFVASKTG